MEHQYLVTNDIPQLAALGREIPAAVDFDGAVYLRQEGQGLLVGTYEQDCRHWAVDGTPPDFGIELLPPDVDRIVGPLDKMMERMPVMKGAGVKRIVNGGMVFSPDGNPIIGPLPGRDKAFVAAGCMAGFSQGGGIGLAVARWIVDGEPGMDVFAMDVSRFGDFANAAYVRSKTRENYQRRVPCVPLPSTIGSPTRARSSACPPRMRFLSGLPARARRPKKRRPSTVRRRSSRWRRNAGRCARRSGSGRPPRTASSRSRVPVRRHGSTAFSRIACRARVGASP
jgi:dimethylglycine dehydrogenase